MIFHGELLVITRWYIRHISCPQRWRLSCFRHFSERKGFGIASQPHGNTLIFSSPRNSWVFHSFSPLWIFGFSLVFYGFGLLHQCAAKDVISNPADFDHEGRLHIKSFHAGNPDGSMMKPMCIGQRTEPPWKIHVQLRGKIQNELMVCFHELLWYIGQISWHPHLFVKISLVCLDIVSIMVISPFSSVSSSYRKSHGFLRRVNLMAAHSAPAICARWLGNPFRRSVESAAADGNCQNL